MPEVLRATGLEKAWTSAGRPVHAVRGVSLAVEAGESVVIQGPSGSGKTTLLTLLGGLLRPDAGQVIVDGIDLGRASDAAIDTLRRERMGFVFQRGLLLADLTALENVALPLRASGRSRREASSQAGELLDRLGLGDRANLHPDALSAGEAQRVALARALAHRPRLVLADEPTAHLDSVAGAAVASELRRLAAEHGSALIVVTHDERLAPIGDRVLHLADGRLVEGDRAPRETGASGDAIPRPAMPPTSRRRGRIAAVAAAVAMLAAAIAGGAMLRSAAWRPTGTAGETRLFRFGVDGYAGTRDVRISAPTEAEPSGSAVADEAAIDLAGAGEEGASHGLLRFADLRLPAGARVRRATLTLTLDVDRRDALLQGAYLARSWDATAGETGVSWFRRSRNRAWAAPGATGEGTDHLAHAGFRVTGFPAGRAARTIDLDPELVQQWIDRPSEAHGLLLRVERGRARVLTSEQVDPSLRPTLEIIFDVAAPGASATGLALRLVAALARGLASAAHAATIARHDGGPAPSLAASPDVGVVPQTPTVLDVVAVGGDVSCGSVTTAGAPSEGIPNLVDPADPLADPNAVCRGERVPKACCEGAGRGHCDEGRALACNAFLVGGGANGQPIASPWPEVGMPEGSTTRYRLSCSGPFDTACQISGSDGDRARGVLCSLAGCELKRPMGATLPDRSGSYCAISRLARDAYGSLDLSTGAISLTHEIATDVQVRLGIGESAPCARCVDPSMRPVSGSPASPGRGTCDGGLRDGESCESFEPPGRTAGFTSDCPVCAKRQCATSPVADGGGTIRTTIELSTKGAETGVVPSGTFCPGEGQAGNAACTARGEPLACCDGAGVGTCPDRSGCFASGNHPDTPARCTSITVAGKRAGMLLVGDPTPPIATFGGIACASGARGDHRFFANLIDRHAGMPGPVVGTNRALLRVR